MGVLLGYASPSVLSYCFILSTIELEKAVVFQGFAADFGLKILGFWVLGIIRARLRKGGAKVKLGNKRKYDALANVPWQVRADIQRRIERMPDGNDKTILALYFISGMSSPEIVRYCEVNGIRSRVNTFYTKRSVNYIVSKYFPEVSKYRRRNPEGGKRELHFKYIQSHRKERCGKCGSTENLEWHHMIPLSIGGKTCEENMVCLCSECHRKITSYHYRTGIISST